MKKLLATITDEAYEALKAFKEENGFANIDTALDELLKREGEEMRWKKTKKK